MDIFKIVFLTLVALVLILVVERSNKEIGILLLLITSIFIFLSIISGIKEVINILKRMAEGAGINSGYLMIILKMTGIAYLVEIVKNVCTDAGNSSLATKVEIAGKVSMACLTIPLITNVINLVEGLI